MRARSWLGRDPSLGHLKGHSRRVDARVVDDYPLLAQRISVSVPEVRGCLILSRDGMILGAHPDDESLTKSAWLRFVALGEPERSFVEFADQTWAFVRRGPYAAFAVAAAGVRPGVLIDQLEQVVLTAEEGRSRRDTLRVPDAANAPSGKPRTSLHPGGGKEGGESKGKDRVTTVPIEVGVQAAAPERSPSPETGEDPPDEGVPDGLEEPPATGLKKEPQRLIGSGSEGREDETEVDRVLLAKEFFGLLQLRSPDDEADS